MDGRVIKNGLGEYIGLETPFATVANGDMYNGHAVVWGEHGDWSEDRERYSMFLHLDGHEFTWFESNGCTIFMYNGDGRLISVQYWD